MADKVKHPRAGALKPAVTPNETQVSKAKKAVELCLLSIEKHKELMRRVEPKPDKRIFLTRDALKDFTGLKKLFKGVIEAFCAEMLAHGWTMAPTQKAFHTSEDWLLFKLGRSEDADRRVYISDEAIEAAREELEQRRIEEQQRRQAKSSRARMVRMNVV